MVPQPPLSVEVAELSQFNSQNQFAGGKRGRFKDSIDKTGRASIQATSTGSQTSRLHSGEVTINNSESKMVSGGTLLGSTE